MPIAGRVGQPRLSEGRIEIKHDLIAIDELIGAVLARLRETLARHPVTLNMPADLPLVPGDEVMLEQVVSNLLENAARHTPAARSRRCALLRPP